MKKYLIPEINLIIFNDCTDVIARSNITQNEKDNNDNDNIVIDIFLE